jgi:pimeloyl-ACP methyl ester carboxylesterase
MVRVNTPELAFRDEGRGPAVLLIHGFPLGGWMWEAEVRALVPRYRTIVPDLPGFGASPPEVRTPSIDRWADDLAALLAARGVERTAIVGFSMGGYVALSIAARYPRLVAALVLADTRAAADSEEAKRARDDMADLARREGAGAVADRMVERLFAKRTRELRPGLVAAARARMSAVSPDAIVAALLAMRDRPDRTAALAAIRAPALVIVGAEDAITPVAEAEKIKGLLPDARLAVIPGAGHASNLEEPAVFDRALLLFFDEALAGRGRDGVAPAADR